MKPFVITKNLDQLYRRISLAMRTRAVTEIRTMLSSLPDRVLTVGTGGSYAAALFAAKCINAFANGVAVAMKPRDALLCPIEKFGAVLLFSYSGTTNDIRAVYQFCREKGVAVCVVTALEPDAEHCPYAREEMISYAASDPDYEERGFISMASTLIPMCLVAQHYYPEGEFDAFLQSVFAAREREFATARLSCAPRPLVVDIFSAYDTETASAILESDITESGIGRATVHEKKDFSHGRYNAIEAVSPDVAVFLDNSVGAYTKLLKDYLSGRTKRPLWQITTAHEGVWGDFDLVVAVQFFIVRLSEDTDYDMSDPAYPDEAKRLYKYGNFDIL